MKILELCLSVGMGGLELYVYRTAKELSRTDDSCISVVRDASFLHKKMQANDLPCICLNRMSYKLPLLSARKLATIVKRNNIDIIHVHWGKDLLLASLAKRLCHDSVKLVYTRQMMLTRAKKDWYHRFVYANVDLYLVITDELSRLAQSYLPLPTTNIIRLSYGVKIPKGMSPQQREEIRFAWLGQEADFIVGIVGRIEEQKGQFLLINAVNQLLKKQLSIGLVIVGPSMQQSYLDDLKRYVKDLEIDHVVKFTGSHPNPVDIMPAMDCVVLATRKETFGLVLVEAMRANVAVVGSNSGGVPEIIDHAITGLLFEPDNVDDLSTQLQRLVKDNDFCTKIAAAGKRKADKEFSHDTHYKKLKQIFSELLK